MPGEFPEGVDTHWNPARRKRMSIFSEDMVPDMLWPDLLTIHATIYDYHLAEGDTRSGLRGMLMEGLEGEPVSPGRYARMWVDTRDLPRQPRASDWLHLNGDSYDVESVSATVNEMSQLVIKRSGQSWLE
jgi:hypothetical protein